MSAEQDIIIKLKERLDLLKAEELENRLAHASSAQIKNIILDCSELAYISSAGLRVVLKLAKQLNAAGKGYRLVNVNHEVYKIFKMTGFTNILDISRGDHASTSCI